MCLFQCNEALYWSGIILDAYNVCAVNTHRIDLNYGAYTLSRTKTHRAVSPWACYAG